MNKSREDTRTLIAEQSQQEGPLFVGVDFGTSGARSVIINTDGLALFQAKSPYDQSSSSSLPSLWEEALRRVLTAIPPDLRSRASAVSINGTSATATMCDRTGTPVTAPLLYNDDSAKVSLDRLKSFAPPNHTVLSPTSTLAKLVHWFHTEPQVREEWPRLCLQHQADWLAFLLHGRLGFSDYNNALKLGYDVQELKYPDWLDVEPWRTVLPEVVAPGDVLGNVTPSAMEAFGLPEDCAVCAGTTDSIAAFLASGASNIGDAVTSLGSTLAMKQLSTCFIEDARYGIYSHRLDDMWLVGGASNTGGAVLESFFSREQLAQLSARIDPKVESLLNYYPLLKPGDRFPINDPDLEPCLEPRPESDSEFLHGMLESIARLEAKGYALLQELGAEPLRTVHTAGGGATNDTWAQIRARHLGLLPTVAPQTEAAYGSALLARKGFMAFLAKKGATSDACC